MELKLVRKNLMSQHEMLRGLMTDLEGALATGADTTALLKGLHDALVSHNAAEEAVLVPILTHIDAWGPTRVELMLTEHRSEHALLVEKLSPTAPAETLRELITHMRGHMAYEEEHLLSAKLLQDDVVIVDAD